MTGLLAPDFAATPYWWRAAPPPEAMPGTLPKLSDVVVVGGGYAGLSAALTMARAGRSVCVLDANSPGWGASTRSVGMIGGRLRQGYAALAATLGEAGAIDLMCEARDAYAWFRGFVDAEGIDCAMRITGRLLCAWTPADLKRLGGLARFLSGRIGIPAEMLDHAALRQELGSDLHHGAMLLPQDGGVHPAELHRGLLEAAQRAGATVIAPAAVRCIERGPDGFKVSTAVGEITGRDVLLATNAHTGKEFPWFRKRVIPVGSYMIATETLPRKLLDELMPKHRLVNDTRQLAYAFRRAPDQDRLLVGGRASALDHADPKRVVYGLHRIMRGLFPELADARVSHAWGGMVAFTFDRLPRIGTHDGIHYVLGCNGSGVVMNTYLGSKAGARLVGAPDGATRFARDDFPTHPLYTGSPWFMAPLTAWYDLRDRAARLAAR